MPVLEQVEHQGEQLLTKNELCELVLRCDVKTADKFFINKEGFPFIRVGKRKRYPLRQVEKWLEENTLYN